MKPNGDKQRFESKIYSQTNPNKFECVLFLNHTILIVSQFIMHYFEVLHIKTTKNATLLIIYN